MKTLNADAPTPVVRSYAEDGEQPGWYATVEKGESLKDNQWRVGIVYPDGEKDEYMFKFSSVGRDKESLERANSGEFGIALIDKFKQGGQKAVKDWLSQGCP